MPSVLSSLLTLAPWHLITFSTLLGAELYQSWVMTKVCYRALTMQHFVTLQSRVFPTYFLIQLSGTALTIITYPPVSFRGLFKHKSEAIALGIMLGTSLLNFFMFGPRTKQAMFDRVQQESIDGKAYNDESGRSEEMQKVCRRFSKNHAMSIHLNLIGMLAGLFYAFRLASKLKFN